MTPKQLNKIAWPIYARPLRDGSGQILVREWRDYGVLPDGRKYMIYGPTYFQWDGASIPKFAWSFIGSPFTGKYQRAALNHDLLYVFHTVQVGTEIVEVDRKFADRRFLDDMTEDRVSAQKADTMWQAVRRHGSGAWRS